MRTQSDERKFTELLLYVASRLQDDPAGGATKLDKVMFIADFAHVRRMEVRSQVPSTRSWSTDPRLAA